MSLDLGTMYAKVELDNKDFNLGLEEMPEAAESAFRRIADLAVKYLAFRQIYQYSKGMIQSFSEMEEAANRFNAVFAQIPATASETAQKLQNEFNLSKQATFSMLASVGDLLTGFGFAQRQALALADAAARLGADLYSYTNYAGGAQGATEAITKAMLGETESVKALGVVIRQTSPEFMALMKKYEMQGFGENQAKAMTVLEQIRNQSKNAIGDWNRPGLTVAQQFQMIEQSGLKASENIGREIAEAVKPVLKAFNSLLDLLGKLDSGTIHFIGTTGLLTAALAGIAKYGKKQSEVNNIAPVIPDKNQMNSVQTQMAAVNRSNSVLVRSFSTLKMQASNAFLSIKAGAMSAIAGVKALGTALAGIMMQMLPMLLISAAISGVMYLLNRGKQQSDTRRQIAAQESQKATEEYQKGNEDRAADQQKFHRLEQLAAYTRLTSNEQEEAAGIVAELKKTYGDLNIELDKTTGRLRVGADAWRQMTTAQKAAALKQKKAQLETAKQAINADFDGLRYAYNGGAGDRWQYNRMAQMMKRMSIDEQIKYITHLKNRTRATNDQEGYQYLSEMLTRLEEYKKSLEEAKRLQESFAESADKTGQRNRSEEERKQIQQIEEIQFEIKFNDSSLNEKIDLYKKKMEDIFAKQKNFKTIEDMLSADSTRFTGADAAKQLEIKKQLLELQKKIRDLQKEGADYGKSVAEESFRFALRQASAATQTDMLTAKRDELLKQLNGKLQERGVEQAALNDLRPEEQKIHHEILNLNRQLEESKTRQRQIDEDAARNRWNRSLSFLDTEEKIAAIAARRMELEKLLGNKVTQPASQLNAEDRRRQEEAENLRYQEAQIRDNGRKSIENLNYTDSKADEQRRKSREDKLFERQLQNLRDNGQQDVVRQLIQKEYESAKTKAEQMAQEYEKIKKDAFADGVISDAERKQLDRARDAMREAQNRQDSMEEKVYQENRQHKNSQAVGSWSLAQLAQSLNAPSAPEKETARNTRLTVNLLRAVKSNTSQKTSETTYE